MHLVICVLFFLIITDMWQHQRSFWWRWGGGAAKSCPEILWCCTQSCPDERTCRRDAKNDSTKVNTFASWLRQPFWAPRFKQGAFQDAADEAFKRVTAVAIIIGSITHGGSSSNWPWGPPPPSSSSVWTANVFLGRLWRASFWCSYHLQPPHLLQLQKWEDILQNPSFQGLMIHWPGGKQGRRSMKT